MFMICYKTIFLCVIVPRSRTKFYNSEIGSKLVKHHQIVEYYARTNYKMDNVCDACMHGLVWKSGCCRPPAICGMEYVNATFWLKKNVLYTHDPDCDLWENDETMMCYNCNSCREGYFTTLKSKWWRLGVFLVSMAVLLIVSHLLLFLSTMLQRYNQI